MLIKHKLIMMMKMRDKRGWELKEEDKREKGKFDRNDGSWVDRSGVSQSGFKSFYSPVM